MYYNRQAPFYSPRNPEQANHNPRKKQITVFGEGSIDVEPDTVNITIGVMTENSSASTAQTENAKITTTIMQSLQNLGIPSTSIKTVQYDINAIYDYEDGKQIFKGYRVTHLLRIVSNDVTQAGKIIDTAVASGANVVNNIEFTISNPDQYYNQALTIAVKNSIQKANTISSTLGITIQPTPYQISEITTTGHAPLPQQVQFMASVETPISPGQLKVNAKIESKFAIQ
ncbi:SIMPL domain-containing protein [Bacillus sp. Marseille-P3661]|uniref:SIMPL domain-containing protein n=1 Tax=Bacillus sp. Marseille-P3661 TaxID=1936234 RepID=UPI000C81E4A9|nr:SIMPL domain-containing protein [Bacillus sp. Marseille-P3661]